MLIRKILSTSWQALAALWALIILFNVCLQVHYLLKNGFDYDHSHLYPIVNVDDTRVAALDNLSTIANYRVVYMAGIPAESAEHFDAFVKETNEQWQAPSGLKKVRWEGAEINEYYSFYRLISDRLMNLIDQHTISQLSDEELLARALESLTAVGQSTFIAKTDDPLGFFARWAQKRLPQSTLLSSGDTFKIYGDNYVWAIFIYEAAPNLEGLSPSEMLRATDELRKTAQRIHPLARVLVNGRPYLSAVLYRDQLQEIVATALLSLLIMYALLRRWSTSPRLFMLVCMSIGSGLVMGMTALHVIYNKLSLWAMLLSAPMAGVSCILAVFYLLTQREFPKLSFSAFIERISAPILWLTFIVAVSYGLLYIVPLPGIREFSVFSCACIISSTITVMLLFPAIRIDPISHSDFSRKMTYWVHKFPRLSLSHWQTKPTDYTAAALAFFVVLTAGFIQLDFDQDIGDLSARHQGVHAEHRLVNSLLTLPDTEHFFVINAPTPQDVLMSEEALRLGFVQRGMNKFDMTTTCLSKWFPSYTRQQSVEALRQDMFERIRAPLSDILGYPLPEPQPPQIEVTFEEWLASPSASPVRHLWLDVPHGYSSIIQIAGIDEDNFPALEQLAESIAGATFVNTIGDLNELISQYRYTYVGIFVLAVVCTFTVCLFHYGLRSWRIVIPPLLGVASGISLGSWVGLSFTVFSALSMVLIYGLGISIAILYYTSDEHESLSFSLTAFATIISTCSFAMLGLSTTPAIATLCLTVAFGLAVTGFIILFIRQKLRQSING